MSSLVVMLGDPFSNFSNETCPRSSHPSSKLSQARPAVQTAIQAAREARQGVGFEIDVEAFSFYFRDCQASASCQGVPGNGSGTVAILEINNKVEPSRRHLDSLE